MNHLVVFHHVFHKNFRINYSSAQHIKMISEGSCDTATADHSALQQTLLFKITFLFQLYFTILLFSSYFKGVI